MSYQEWDEARNRVSFVRSIYMDIAEFENVAYQRVITDGPTAENLELLVAVQKELTDYYQVVADRQAKADAEFQKVLRELDEDNAEVNHDPDYEKRMAMSDV